VHHRLYNVPTFKGAVRALQFNASDTNGLGIVAQHNVAIEEQNSRQVVAPNIGKFPLPYLLDKYQVAQNMRKAWKEENNSAQKDALAALYRTVAESSQDFCRERQFPSSWALESSEIDEEPDWTQAGTNRGGSTQGGGGGGASGNSGPSGDSGTDPNGDTTMHDFTEAMDNLTIDGEPIIRKRKVFKNVQFLVEERSGLHVWKSAASCGVPDSDSIPFTATLTKEFIAQRKSKYRGMSWIALAVDDAITQGAGSYPSISIMAQWSDLEDTLMWRSDLIKIVGQTRVDQDLQRQLPYRKMVTFEGRQVFVLSATESGLLNGEMKAMKRIKNDQFKAIKGAQSSAIAPYTAQQGIAQPALAQPVSAYGQSGQPAYQQGYSQAGYPQAAPYAQPGFPQAAPYAQPGFPQAASTQPGNPQGASAQSVPTQSVPAQLPPAQPAYDMDVMSRMIAEAVQRFYPSAQPAMQQQPMPVPVR